MKINHKIHTLLESCIFLLYILVMLSCEKEDLIFSTINTDSIAFKEVEITGISLNEEDGIITLTIPYGSSISQLSPSFNIIGGGESIPASGTTQDFSRPVYYTIIHPSGGKRVYQFIVVLEQQPSPLILDFSETEIIAGQKLLVNGSNFGNFGLALKAALLSNEKLVSGIPVRLISPSQVELSVPDSISPGDYKVTIAVNDKSVISEKSVRITYPAPIINYISRKNSTQGDTLYLKGRFLDLNQYEFEIVLNKDGVESTTPGFSNPAIKGDSSLSFVCPLDILPGQYSLRVLNMSRGLSSALFGDKLNIYEFARPFVRSILDPKPSYEAQDIVTFSTSNFDKAQARFYQVLLKKGNVTIAQNGIYDSVNERLSIVLPASIDAGVYLLDFFLSNPTENYQYSFSTDLKITIQ